MFLYDGSWCQLHNERDIKKGDEKRKGGLIHLSALWGGGRGAASQIFAYPPHLEKIPPPTWKNPPVSRLPSPVLADTKFLFPQASKPKPLNWYRHNSTMVSALNLKIYQNFVGG